MLLCHDVNGILQSAGLLVNQCQQSVEILQLLSWEENLLLLVVLVSTTTFGIDFKIILKFLSDCNFSCPALYCWYGRKEIFCIEF